ncbi:hypothetical protein FLK61_39515 [Paenalkalicoccus suaedae]|uniref:Uncharacterized protein n=1 Tax=Paenalkalicoccus suaedae TaxID=2592382 RepID=A0A859FJB4_9BACI|nr:hypothetical protein [Paenalkalicoccus suaedae]QKS72705.1 hypothetical protein FLK61_39515 [Paenalkalicoccus suaedae]
MTKKIEKELKNMQIRVPKRAHDRSLERAMAGISEARKHGSGQKGGKKIAAGVAGTLVAASIGGILVLSELGGDTTPVPGDNEPGENNVDVENEAMEDNGVENEVVDNEGIDDANEPEVEDTEPAVEIDAPETKEIVTMQEGMEQTDTYQLVSSEMAPFITYVPEGFEGEFEYIEEEAATVGTFLREMDGVLIRATITYVEEPLTDEILSNHGEQFAQWEGDIQMTYLGDDYLANAAAWIEELQVAASDEDNLGSETYFGKHEDNYFMINGTFTQEAAEGWASVRDVIFDEWIWTDTGEGLEGQED